MIIRFLLIVALSGFALALARSSGMRSRAWSLILLFLLLGLGVVAVVAPEWTTVIANVVGVGRGADLLIYLLIITLAFAVLVMYTRIKMLQTQLSRVVREISLQGVVSVAKAQPAEFGDETGDE